MSAFSANHLFELTMKKGYSSFTLYLFLFILSALSFQQVTAKELPGKGRKDGPVRLYLEGNIVDFNYIRRNVSFVDFVNDPDVADVHVIVKKRTTGSGGANYAMSFYSIMFDQIGDFTLNCNTYPSQTWNEMRDVFLRTLKMGIMPFVNEATGAESVNIKGNKADTTFAEKQPLVDQWNNWVFRIQGNGSLSLEERKKNFDYSFSGRADKVTEDWRVRNNLSYSSQIREYIRTVETDTTSYDETVRTENIYKGFSSSVVRSLTERWSFGGFFNLYSSTYRNIKYSYSLKPAIEYNFFPWDEADKRTFTIAYYAGGETVGYFEKTIFDKTQQWLWGHTLAVDFEVVQPWGGIEARVRGNQYLQMPEKYSLEFNTGINLRVAKGLSVNLGFNAESIHNQLYLPLGDISDEDLLLNTRKLPTSFEISSGIGLRYQFGSIFNSVVNTRL